MPIKRRIKDIKIYIHDLAAMVKYLEPDEVDLQDTLFDMETDAGGLLKAIGEVLTILEEEYEG